MEIKEKTPMKQPRIARAILRALSLQNMSQADFASRSGLAPSSITHILKGRRPSPEILRAVVTSWPDHKAGISVLAEHLRDEIDHAGGQHAHISIGTGEKGPVDIVDALRELEAEARISQSTRDLILDMAALLREFHSRPYSDTAVAAEDPANEPPEPGPRKAIRYKRP